MKPIKTNEDYESALEQISNLMDSDPNPGSIAEDELEVLAILVETYEKENIQRDPPDPVEAIKFRIDQQGLSKKDLEPIMGGKSKVSEVLNYKRPLSISMIRKLNKHLGISAEVLLGESRKQIEEPNIHEIEYPLKEMWKANYFPSAGKYSLEKVKQKKEPLLKELFSVFGGTTPRPIFLRKGTNKSEKQTHLLQAWQAKCIANVKELTAPEFKRDFLTKKLPREIAKLSFLDDGPRLVVELLGLRGIHVVVEKQLPKTYLEGASFLAPSGNPIIGMTLRFDRLDNFWFTLLHELGHVYADIHDNSEAFFDSNENFSKQNEDPRERKANNFAANALIPNELWKESRPKLINNPTIENVKTFAAQVGVSSAVVAGRLRWELDDYKILSRSVGNNKVRKQFPEVF